jgi:hypothetical protein
MSWTLSNSQSHTSPEILHQAILKLTMNLSAFFTLALASVLTFSSTAVGQDCPKPACCDVLVKGADDSNVGCE